MPAGVAGTFTIRLGRSTAAHSRSASATVAFGIVGQVGRAFQADIAVSTLRLLIDRTQHVGRGTDIGDRQVLVDRGDAVVRLRLELFQRIRVFIGFADRLLEDRRIRGDALQPVALDERAQLAALDQAALQDSPARATGRTFRAASADSCRRPPELRNLLVGCAQPLSRRKCEFRAAPTASDPRCDLDSQ